MLSKGEPTGKQESDSIPLRVLRENTNLVFSTQFFLYKIFAKKIKIGFIVNSLHPFQKVFFASALLSQKRYVGKGTLVGAACSM